MKKGFALILVLLFAAIAMIVVGAISLAMISDINLTNQSKIFTQAYSLSRGGIYEGWNKYLINAAGGNPNVSVPANTSQVNIFYQNAAGDYVSVPSQDLTTWMTANQRADYPNLTTGSSGGFYAYQVCIACGANFSNYILSSGYYMGKKITLKALITQDATNHAKDTIKIFQTSP